MKMLNQKKHKKRRQHPVKQGFNCFTKNSFAFLLDRINEIFQDLIWATEMRSHIKNKNNSDVIK